MNIEKSRHDFYLRKFLLIDINSYFATLLQQENPFLRGKPVAIVKETGRTCIIAASKEAKKCGIQTGSNVVQARQMAPELVVMGAEFDLYLDATKRLIKIFQNVSPRVNVYSLDEAFVEITQCGRLRADARTLAQNIQQQIQTELGSFVTSNVGIGPNRFLAKMAAEIAPKGSVLEINQENLDPILAQVGFADVCGIGPRLARKLALMGVTHPYQIRFYDEQDLQPLFGPFWSQELLKMAYGQEPHHLALLDKEFVNDGSQAGTQRDYWRPPQSVSRSITLWQLADDEQEIKQVLYNLTREVIFKVRKLKMAGRRISVSLSGSHNFQDLFWKSHQTLSTFVNHTQQMFEIVYQKLYSTWQRNFKPIKFRVCLSLLKPTKQINPSLLPSWQKQEAVETALDEIAERYGLFAVRSALLTKEKQIIRPEVTGFLGDKQYQLSK